MARRARGRTSSLEIAIGARVRELRLAHRMTQEELGEAIGVTFQQVQKYETGVDRISASRLWMIARALSQPVSMFFPNNRGSPRDVDAEERKH